MNKKFFAIFGAVTMILTMGASCGGGGPAGDVRNEVENAVGEAINAAQNVKGQFDLRQIKEWKGQNEEFTVTYFAREYATWPEVKRTGTGQATYKITGSETMDKAGIWEAKPGEKIFGVYLEVRGDAENFGQPSSFDQTGSDPSPQFSLVDKAGKKYSMQTSESGSVARAAGGKSMLGLDLDSDKSIKTAVAFLVPENIAEPTLVLAVRTSEKQYEYYGIKLY